MYIQIKNLKFKESFRKVSLFSVNLPNLERVVSLTVRMEINFQISPA